MITHSNKQQAEDIKIVEIEDDIDQLTEAQQRLQDEGYAVIFMRKYQETKGKKTKNMLRLKAKCVIPQDRPGRVFD